jgi:hypothetical protein
MCTFGAYASGSMHISPFYVSRTIVASKKVALSALGEIGCEIVDKTNL